MSEPDPSFLSEFGEQDRIHFRNLALVRPQLPSESQLNLVEGMARSLSNARLLTLIARTSHWLVHGPILSALTENEFTPEPIRRDLEMAVSLFDLMRNLDRATPAEREEQSEAAKQLYQQLPPDLKPIAKALLKSVARQVNPTGTTLELPPLPTEVDDWDALTRPPRAEPTRVQLSKHELMMRAGSTHGVEELQGFLIYHDAEVRHAALHNPLVSEELLTATLRQCTLPDFFDEIYGEARWYFQESIREAIQDAPHAPLSLVRRLRVGQDLVCLLRHGVHSHSELRRVTALFTQLDEGEYQFVTLWAKRQAPNLLRVVKIFYDRLQRKRTTQASGLSSRPAEARWASLEERVFLANQSTQADQLVASLRDPDPTVFAIVLENPVLTPREISAAIPSLDQIRVERLAHHHTWGENPAVREALLHSDQLTRSTALRLLESITALRALLDILRDPRIPHLEVKQQAMETLRRHYLSMGTQERILALRGSGGELIRHLPQEILKDEETLQQLISDRQLDPSILLRLARHKQTPRAILDQIAAHPILMAHPPIMSELLLNPKTPRESSIRIWGLLSESEQSQLLRSPHLPATLRQLASS
jgi:hypothetical protein